MEGGIYCTYGYFGTFKTLWNVALIKKKLSAWEIVFSNIKINGSYFSNYNNYFYFDDIEVLHDVLAFSAVFASKVSEYNQTQWNNGLPSFDRSLRPKINIIFDELAVFADSWKYREFAKNVWYDLAKYLVQIRKLWVNLYMIIQKPNKLVKELRQYVEYWIKPEPKFSIFKDKCINYYKVSLDLETFKIETETKEFIDFNGDVKTYEKQIKKHFFSVWYTPYYFNFYDDTYLNLDIKTIVFKSDYLKKVWLLNKIVNNKLNHKVLFDNVKIYEPFKDTLYNDSESFALDEFNPNNFKKNSFFDNPFYYFYVFTKQFWYYSRNPFKSLFFFLKFLLNKIKNLKKSVK